MIKFIKLFQAKADQTAEALKQLRDSHRMESQPPRGTDAPFNILSPSERELEISLVARYQTWQKAADILRKEFLK